VLTFVAADVDATTEQTDFAGKLRCGIIDTVFEYLPVRTRRCSVSAAEQTLGLQVGRRSRRSRPGADHFRHNRLRRQRARREGRRRDNALLRPDDGRHLHRLPDPRGQPDHHLDQVGAANETRFRLALPHPILHHPHNETPTPGGIREPAAQRPEKQLFVVAYGHDLPNIYKETSEGGFAVD